MNDRHNNESETELQAPPALVRALKNIPRETIFIPSYVDASILKAARQQISKPAGTSRRFFHWLLWPAFATCIVVALSLISRAPVRYAAGDLNHDGRVDILDSFALAREIKSGKVSQNKDVNGDGIVDQRDVDALAVRAVRLEKTSS